MGDPIASAGAQRALCPAPLPSSPPGPASRLVCLPHSRAGRRSLALWLLRVHPHLRAWRVPPGHTPGGHGGLGRQKHVGPPAECVGLSVRYHRPGSCRGRVASNSRTACPTQLPHDGPREIGICIGHDRSPHLWTAPLHISFSGPSPRGKYLRKRRENALGTLCPTHSADPEARVRSELRAAPTLLRTRPRHSRW